MRQIDVNLDEGDELIRLWATRGRRYYFALIECEDNTFRLMMRLHGACCYEKNVNRVEAIADVETRIHVAWLIDDIKYSPIEASCNLSGTRG